MARPGDSRFRLVPSVGGNPPSRRRLSGLLLVAASALLMTAVSGCRPTGDPTDTAAPATVGAGIRRGPVPIHLSPDPWVLSTDAWDADHRGAYLGNGYVGQNITPAGGLLVDPARQQSFLAGYYEGEALEALPCLTPLRIAAGAQVLGGEPEEVKQYHQELRLREGMLATRGIWGTAGGDVSLELETAFLRHRPDTALLRVSVDNRGTTPLTVGVPEQGAGEPSAGGGELPPNSYRYRWGQVEGLVRLQCLDRSDLPTGTAPAGYRIAFTLPPQQKATFALTTQVSHPRIRPKSKAAGPLRELTPATVDREFREHAAAWEQLWKSDLEIEGDPEAQQVVRACLFYLLSSVRADHAGGMPPMGLSTKAFNGHVFWDMDSWMLPALLPQYPGLARAMTEYRFNTLPGARANARAEKLPGASYAWESGGSGQETLKAEVFRHGRHVTGDVALALKQYYAATGDDAWLRSRAWPILKETADQWVARAQPDGEGGYVVKQVTTPDENAGQVDHSAWTHHVARVNLEFAAETARKLGQPGNPKWATVAKGLGFLRDPQGVIRSHSAFTERSKSKQADALLLVHPGEADLPQAEVERLYDFYAPRVIETGPAMTDAIHAVVAARLGRREEALEQFRESYRPFVRPPFHLFSEKRTRDNLCFLTGAAGVVEAVLYGFAGLELKPGAAGGRPQLKPQLPPGWQALRVKGLHWRGKTWDVELKPGAAPTWAPR